MICVNSAKEADHVASLLESQCIGALKVTEFMSPAELKDVQMNWDYVVKSRKANECVLGELLLDHKFSYVFTVLKLRQNFP